MCGPVNVSTSEPVFAAGQFTDIAGSTEQLSSQGDSRWRHELDIALNAVIGYDAAIRSKRHAEPIDHGRRVDHTCVQGAPPLRYFCRSRSQYPQGLVFMPIQYPLLEPLLSWLDSANG